MRNKNENERKYFSMIPHLIDDLGLSPSAVRLYLHYIRVAGENGVCWQSVRTIAKVCRMSGDSVLRARRELDDNNLIFVYHQNPNGKRRGSIRVSIRDIWVDNISRYRHQLGIKDCSPGEHPSRNNAYAGNIGSKDIPECSAERIEEKPLKNIHQEISKISFLSSEKEYAPKPLEQDHNEDDMTLPNGFDDKWCRAIEIFKNQHQYYAKKLHQANAKPVSYDECSSLVVITTNQTFDAAVFNDRCAQTLGRIFSGLFCKLVSVKFIDENCGEA